MKRPGDGNNGRVSGDAKRLRPSEGELSGALPVANEETTLEREQGGVMVMLKKEEGRLPVTEEGNTATNVSPVEERSMVAKEEETRIGGDNAPTDDGIFGLEVGGKLRVKWVVGDAVVWFNARIMKKKESCVDNRPVFRIWYDKCLEFPETERDVTFVSKSFLEDLEESSLLRWRDGWSTPNGEGDDEADFEENDKGENLGVPVDGAVTMVQIAKEQDEIAGESLEKLGMKALKERPFNEQVHMIEKYRHLADTVKQGLHQLMEERQAAGEKTVEVSGADIKRIFENMRRS